MSGRKRGGVSAVAHVIAVSILASVLVVIGYAPSPAQAARQAPTAPLPSWWNRAAASVRSSPVITGCSPKTAGPVPLENGFVPPAEVHAPSGTDSFHDSLLMVLAPCEP